MTLPFGKATIAFIRSGIVILYIQTRNTIVLCIGERPTHIGQAKPIYSISSTDNFEHLSMADSSSSLELGANSAVAYCRAGAVKVRVRVKLRAGVKVRACEVEV